LKHLSDIVILRSAFDPLRYPGPDPNRYLATLHTAWRMRHVTRPRGMKYGSEQTQHSSADE
jgi:hypothetical protein